MAGTNTGGAPQSSLEELMADPRLVEMCEMQRTGDEVLDVISLSENQHSDILAWMLDAREGHGQGDEILRDLLVSASALAARGGTGLDAQGTTATFFANWPPSRLRAASFGAAFTARELGMSAIERVDLFVIDTQNKFVLLLENKAGARHHEGQLVQYRKSFEKAAAKNARLRGYSHVYIALDREFDGEEAASRPCSDHWLHLGYDWLKVSATRALMHVERGNNAARLVVSYCNRQTDWEDPNSEKRLRLAAELHQSYPDAIKYLVSSSRGRAELDWLSRPEEPDFYFLFRLQNKGSVALLKETQGMASVRTAVLAKLPSLGSESVDHARVQLEIRPSGWERVEGDEGWPVFLRVRYADDTQTKYTLALCWNSENARTPAGAEDLRRRLTSIDARFGKRSNSQWRHVIVERSLGLPELLRKVAELDARLSKVLPE